MACVVLLVSQPSFIVVGQAADGEKVVRLTAEPLCLVEPVFQRSQAGGRCSPRVHNPAYGRDSAVCGGFGAAVRCAWHCVESISAEDSLEEESCCLRPRVVDWKRNNEHMHPITAESCDHIAINCAPDRDHFRDQRWQE
jgi:hypothetical protein